jgi:hypothetical protein
MHGAGFVAGLTLLGFLLWDAFETIVLPRRVSRRFRLTSFFYRHTWPSWRWLGRRRRAGNSRENFLAVYGPLSLLLLLGIWAFGLVSGFALLYWGLGTKLHAPAGMHGFGVDLYYSGTTLFTLGLGDVHPDTGAGRAFTVIESGMGLGFLALVISYLPVLSQAFSRREANITLLDARAGSPPSALELLRRHGDDPGASLERLLEEWERWSADILETHVSFPVLAYYRSQHDNQSWVAAVTTILDVSALLLAGIPECPSRAAHLTFAMARHTVVDLCNVFRQPPRQPETDRLPPDAFERLRQTLRAHNLPLQEGPAVEEKLRNLRRMYEPWVNALSRHLFMPLPQWSQPEGAKDNWQKVASGLQ